MKKRVINRRIIPYVRRPVRRIPKNNKDNKFNPNKNKLVVIMVLLLVIAGIMYFADNGLNFQKEKETGQEYQSSLESSNVDLKIENVKIQDEEQLEIMVKRSSGKGSFSGLEFVISDGKKTEKITKTISMNEFEKKKFYFKKNLFRFKLKNIKSISVYPVYKNSNGGNTVGNKEDEWKSEETFDEESEEQNESEEEILINQTNKECEADNSCINSTCAGLKCQDSCGNIFIGNLQPNCSVGYCGVAENNCGECYCEDGFGCEGSICVKIIPEVLNNETEENETEQNEVSEPEEPQCIDTCSLLNYECGVHLICNENVYCGSCNEGNNGVCNSNGRCVEVIEEPEEEIVILYYNNFEQNQVGSSSYKNDWSYCMPNPDAGIYRSLSDSQNPTNVFRAYFPKGSWSLNNENGFRCHIEYNENGYDELYLSYKIKFQSGFDAFRGGKLPRLEAKPSRFYSAENCPDGTDVFSGGMMFKKGEDNNPIPVFYLAHPDMWNATWYRNVFYSMKGRYPENCEDVVNVIGSVYSESIYWNETIPRGEWHTITERVVANTPGQYDGFVEGYIDGQLITQVTNLRFRDISSLKINILNFVGFFGGGDEGWATVKDEYIYYDEIMLYYYKNSEKTPSPLNRMIPEIEYPPQSILHNY